MRAKRSLGQNFLVDPNIQRRIVDAVGAGPGDTVIEIGPGRGALTTHLAGAVDRLILIELDDHLAADLEARYAGREDVRVVHGDALQWDPSQEPCNYNVITSGSRTPPTSSAAPAPASVDGRLLVVGNIPYNITSPILFHLLEWRPAPAAIILMVQREVADRLVAAPGGKQYGALTVGVRAVATVERLFHVGRGAFRPVPNVDSTVIRIDPDAALEPVAAERLRSLTRAAFGLRRKQLQKILRTAPDYGLSAEEAEAVLAEVGVRPEERPEALDPAVFIELAAALGRRGFPRSEGAVA